MREAMSGMAFQHPGVTRTVDTIEEDGVLGFLAPFYRGMTLRKLINERIGKLKEGEVPQQPIFALPEIVSILTRVCEAVHYVHTYHKLCHLDLKPENVLITNVDNLDKLQLGDLVVMDFGLSKSLDRKTRSSMYLSGGTLAYMAPEQAEGQQKSRGTWTDVHAMGMILFECCTGTAVMGKKIRYPSDRWPKHIPSTVDELIAASIEDEPSERIQTVAEFSEKLTKTLSKSKPKSGPKSKPITPIPEVIKNQILPNVMGKVTKAASRPLWQFWALGGVLVSMLLLLLLWFAMPTECKSGEVRACGTSTDVGECRKGQERCAGGKWSGVCEGERKARAEVCNGRDDDCDGVIDNNAQCPSGQLCSNGKCSCVAGTRQIMEIGGTSIAVRCIPAGSFMMGSPDNEPGRDSNEGPQRRVELTRPFWMMETEVTQGQYQRLMGYNPSAFKNCGANCPVEQVNWHEACAYANALARNQELEECYTCSGSGRGVTCEVKSQYRGSGYYNCKGWRLPTEAEWEYAYRGGTNTPFYTGRCISTEQANYNGNYPQEGCPKGQYRERTIAVGSLNAPNAWGLHDMAGNVWEWVHDWYQDSYRNLTGKDPVNDRTGSRRVLRGGSCYNLARIVRAAGRSRWSPADRYFGVGFRLLRADLSSN
jgi:formylglycine-generating enzyme required for sulfatase activity